LASKAVCIGEAPRLDQMLPRRLADAEATCGHRHTDAQQRGAGRVRAGAEAVDRLGRCRQQAWLHLYGLVGGRGEAGSVQRLAGTFGQEGLQRRLCPHDAWQLDGRCPGESNSRLPWNGKPNARRPTTRHTCFPWGYDPSRPTSGNTQRLWIRTNAGWATASYPQWLRLSRSRYTGRPSARNPWRIWLSATGWHAGLAATVCAIHSWPVRCRPDGASLDSQRRFCADNAWRLWWRRQCKELADDPQRCYGSVHAWDAWWRE